MGLINKYSKGDWVNQNRKSQGGFLEKQDAKSRFFSEKMNNGNNIQKKNTANTDDLPNIPAMLDYALNPPSQGNIKYIDGSKPHTLTANALLTFAGLFSMTHPKTTVPPREAILTDNPNSLLGRVISPTKVNTPVLFGTTPSTSQNHAPSKELTEHSDDPSLIREKRAVDGLIGRGDGNIIVSDNGKKLTFNHRLDIKILKEQLTNNINITELCLWEVATVRQKAQKIGKILKGSNVKELSILHSNIGDTRPIDFGRMLIDTEVTTLNLAYNGIGNKEAIGLIESLKETKVKAVNLKGNNISNKGVNDLILKIRGTKIIEVGIDKRGIERYTLKKLLEVLEQNKHVNKEPTSTIESSTTEEKASTTEKKREKRDIHTTNESTEDTTVPTTEESTVPTTDGSSTTTTKSTASSAGNPTTPKKNLTEKSEPIAADVVVDSITEKHTPKESNPNDPASSTMSTKEILALISFVLTAVSIGGGVAICVVKKFFDGASRLGHNALALADLAESDNHLDNNEETSSLTGVTVRTPSQSEGLDGYEQPKGLPLLIKILLIRQSLNYQVALDS